MVFYASGKAALETSYLYALFARFYGHNNLPDSSNMCHETTSVGLKKVIGSPVGTCELEDFEHCDAIFYFGQNPGTNSPRFLHPLQDAVKRGCKIIVFNPVREKGLVRFVNPQSPVEMLTGKGTDLAHMYLQVKPGGDIAALTGLCKRVFERDDAARAAGEADVLDRAFIEQHTNGFDAFEAKAARKPVGTRSSGSAGLPRADLEAAADVYAQANKVIGVYGMGLTQHVHGSQSIGMLVNLHADARQYRPARGPGCRRCAGIPTCRASAPSASPRSPNWCRWTSWPRCSISSRRGTRAAARSMPAKGSVDGSVKGFVSLGGNFVRAIPDREMMEPAWKEQALTV